MLEHAAAVLGDESGERMLLIRPHGDRYSQHINSRTDARA